MYLPAEKGIMRWILLLMVLALLAGVFVGAPGQPIGKNANSVPSLHHIMIEVADLKSSIRFYHEYLGLSLGQVSGDFAELASANVGIYLWQKRWEFEKGRANDPRGLGIYPHFEVSDVAAAIDRFRSGGYAVVQEPKIYNWGTEAFVRDPDGYTIALVKMTQGGH
jgi:catechol 2,3-dioxygenase-like lactoylglutathione lyase family enzyme